MKIFKLLIAGLIFATASTSNLLAEDAAPAPARKWKNAAEISYVDANGNTKSTTSAGKDTFNYAWTKTALELIASGLGSSSNGVTTAEKYEASEKVDQKVSGRNYVFEKGSWDKDRFAGIRNREQGNLGVGRELLKNKTENLKAELGGGYVSEERVNAPTNNFTSGRAYTKYVHTFSPTANFSQDVEYLHDFDDKDDFRVNTETALTTAITTHFSLKVGYTWKYVGKPAPGFGRSDTLTLISLITTF